MEGLRNFFIPGQKHPAGKCKIVKAQLHCYTEEIIQGVNKVGLIIISLVLE